MNGTIVVSAWEQDPGNGSNPDGGPVIHEPMPDIAKAPFGTKIQGTVPPPGTFTPGTAKFRYWACADALRRASDFWGVILGSARKWNAAVGSAVLPVVLDEGVDLNAYYDRKALNFFHASIKGRMVYSGESPDIVCHEFGHAILDSIRPQLWDAASLEPPAFHESFGDMSAILTALQLPSVRVGVLQETDNSIYRSSRLSRLAEQLGWAIRVKHPDVVEPDCLRNAVNSLFYRNPDDLPTSAPASHLSSEPHSFSRVFTGAFFNALALMFTSGSSHTESDLQQVSQDMARILVQAVRLSAIVPEYYAQVASHMVALAKNESASHANAIKSSMVRHGILSVPGAAIAAGGDGASDLSKPEKIAALTASAEAASLQLQEIDVAGYGLTVSKVHVFASGESKRFQVAGASTNIGDGRATNQVDSARSFFEDLIRRGRLDFGGYAETMAAVIESDSVKSHRLVKEGEKAVLRRLRIDCGFGRHERRLDQN